ncbi:MAG: hypothetical protein A2068_01910 [Ignavibacteria bacterium GWB2_35_6b]|nr:MAG: hypothetical protein A2068_01910 [Ignavibacteria bacterium GWB2_35_6b]
MELLPTITSLLLAAAGFFLIVLIASFVISKFRKEKEVVTESYPAQKYQYFSGNSSGFQQPNYIDKYYYVNENPPAGNEKVIDEKVEQLSLMPGQPIVQNQLNEYYEPESFQNNWVDYESEPVFENPLRKTFSFNVYSENSINEKFNGRMMVINESPVFKYGWE